MSLLKADWQEDFIFTNGVKLHYVTQGQGKLMLLLHGFPEFWYSWRHQISHFAQNYQVVALDLRGYNESDKPTSLQAYCMTELLKDVEGVIKGLGYENCILVGHDWGGAIAWNFAYDYPQMVEKLIIMNLPHPANFRKGLTSPQQLLKSWYIFLFQLPLLPEWLLQLNNYQSIASALVGMSVDKTTFSEEDLEAYKNAAAKEGALTAMVNYYRNLLQDFWLLSQKQWNKLDIPTLMIWGENDEALGKELSYETEDYVTHLTLKYIPNCSHWVQQEKPELVNQYIQEFLAR